MKEIRYTLLAEGNSDRALLPLLKWLLDQHLIDYAVQGAWADLSLLPQPPTTLADRIKTALDLRPCDLLFVHRDADKESFSSRMDEIRRAVEAAFTSVPGVHTIGVIPVHMQEAWLLFNEAALREAADNPNGRTLLELPRLDELEDLPDPKAILNDLLRAASELRRRRSKGLYRSDRAFRLAQLIDSFAPLRILPAFAALEDQIERWADTIMIEAVP